MKNQTKILLIVSFAFRANSAWAHSVADTLHVSKDSNSNQISGVYSAPGKTKDDTSFDLNLDYTKANNNTTDYTGTVTTSTSSDFSVNANWDFSNLWSLGVGYGLGNTDPDNLRTSAPTGSVKKKWLFGDEPKTSDEPATIVFRPSIYLKYGYTRDEFTQTTANRRSTVLLGITQTSSQFSAGAAPWSWLDIDFYYKTFNYNKNVDDFVALLQTPAAVRRFGTAFSSSLNSLSLNEADLALTFHLSDSWDLSLTSVRTVDAPAPQSVGTDNSFAIAYNAPAGWGISLGAGNQSTNDATIPATSYSTLGLRYEF